MSKRTIAAALAADMGRDSAIQHRADLNALWAQLDAANERNRDMAADLSRLAQENAAQAQIIFKQNHELDRLRQHLRGLNRVIGSVLIDGEIEYSADGCDGCGRQGERCCQ